jgi:hypothetical protein
VIIEKIKKNRSALSGNSLRKKRDSPNLFSEKLALKMTPYEIDKINKVRDK